MIAAARDHRIWWWIGAAAAAAAGFLVAPHVIPGDVYGGGIVGSSGLQSTARDSLVAYLDHRLAAIPAPLHHLADYWMRYHVVKAGLAALMVVTLGVVSQRMWASASLPTATALPLRVTAAIIVTTAGVGSALLVAANIQGAIAPLSSVLSLLPVAAPGTVLAATRSGATADLSTGADNPALTALTHDFGVYHAVLAVCAGAVAATCLAMSVAGGRTFMHAEPGSPGRVSAAAATTTFGIATLALAILVAANISNAHDPAHGLLLYFSGS